MSIAKSGVIDVTSLIEQTQKERERQGAPLVKPQARDIARSTAARKYAADANADMIERAEERSMKRVEQLTDSIKERNGHCKVNFFDNAVLTNTDVLHEERKRALRFAQIGDYTRHGPDLSRKLLTSVQRLVFTQYKPLNEYKQIITLTNPTSEQRRFQILPPRVPFAVQQVAGCLSPGESAQIEVFFRPLSYGFFSAELEVRSGDEMQCVELASRNLPWCPKVERILVDDVETNAIIETKTEGFLTEISVDIGSVNKSYTRPHTCKIFIENISAIPDAEAEQYFGKQIRSRYAQNQSENGTILVDNAVHIIGTDIHSALGQKEVQVFISRDQFLECEFRDIEECESERADHEEHYEAENSALQEFLKFERDVFSDAKPEINMEPLYQVYVKRNGLFCLELDFNDALTRANAHEVYIDTLEEYVLKLNFACAVVDGSVTVAGVSNEQLGFPIRAVVDLNNEEFKAIYAEGKLPPDRIFPITVNIDCDETSHVIKREIDLNVDGIDARKLLVQLKPFQEQLMLGYISESHSSYMSEHFMLESEVFDENNADQIIELAFMYPQPQTTVELQNSLSQYLHRETLAKPGPKRAILDISYVNEGEFVLFRAVLTCIPILESYSHRLLVEHNLGIKSAITQLERSTLPQTDYLLISEPAVDLGVIPVETGADFSFQVRNCSKTCYIPYIVSTNLHCPTTSLVTLPGDFGVKFKWTKRDMVSESEVQFPDVCEVFERSFVESLRDNQHEKMPTNYQPQYLRSLESASREKPDSRAARREMSHATNQDTEPVIAFPHAGIIPPQTAVTVSIRVRPLSLGPIEAFIVINTPTAGYYEKVLRAINQRVAETHPRTASAALSRRSSISGLSATKSRGGAKAAILSPISEPLSGVGAFKQEGNRFGSSVQGNFESDECEGQNTGNVLKQIPGVGITANERNKVAALDVNTSSAIMTGSTLSAAPSSVFSAAKQAIGNRQISSQFNRFNDSESAEFSSHLSSEQKIRLDLQAQTELYVNNEQDMKIFDQLREKTIPLSELERLFSQEWEQSVSMEGGFLSERDVCCRVYGIVAATEVEFSQKEYQADTDQLQPVIVKILNAGKTSAEITVEIVKGDASFINPDDIPEGLEPYALQLWLGKQKQRKTQEVQINTNESKQLSVIPGLEDSIIVVKKPIAAFGVMGAELDQDLLDLQECIIIAAAMIKKRLEPLRPYVLLPFFKQNFAILDPETRMLPDLRVSTRPYNSVILEYTIINPSSCQFDCEITSGPDVVAPQLLKVPAQSKAAAKFALNPDRSGEIETFIQFHDAEMRIIIKSFGPDVILKSPFIEEYNNLITNEGMVEPHQKQNMQVEDWDNIVEQIPKQFEIKPIELDDLSAQISEGCITARRASVSRAMLDLSQLESKSLFQQIIGDLPYITLENQGGMQSAAVKLAVINPTGSSMKVAPKIVPVGSNLITLRAEAPQISRDGFSSAGTSPEPVISKYYSPDSRNQKVKLVVGGPLTQNGAIDSPYFVCSPSELELQALGRADVSVRATNMKRLGKYEGILQVNGICIRLECQKNAPEIQISDGERQVVMFGNYDTGAIATVPLENKGEAKLRVGLSIGAPFSIKTNSKTVAMEEPEYAPATPRSAENVPPELIAELPSSGSREVTICLTTEALTEHLHLMALPEHPSLQNILACERSATSLSSVLKATIYSGESEYVHEYQVMASIDSPFFEPRIRKLEFEPTFPRSEHLRFVTFENPSAINANFAILNVPLADIMVLEPDVCEALECIGSYETRCEERYTLGVLAGAKSTFTDLHQVFYSLKKNSIIIDNPAFFEFSELRGNVPGHGGRRPLGQVKFGVRFCPGEDALDRTRDRSEACAYMSAFYIRVRGGRGSFIICEGCVSCNVDDL